MGNLDSCGARKCNIVSFYQMKLTLKLFYRSKLQKIILKRRYTTWIVKTNNLFWSRTGIIKADDNNAVLERQNNVLNGGRLYPIRCKKVAK